jgi:hypothetical protein
MADAEGFFSRWSRRKVQARQHEPLPDTPDTPESPEAQGPSQAPVRAQSVAVPSAPAAAGAPAPAGAVPPAAPAPALPTLEDVQALTPASDFSRFVAPGVSPEVRNAAMKKLFADPFFNEMDGLDIYIDDYSKPNPLPPALARKLVSSQFMNLFEAPPEAAPTPEAAPVGVPAALDESPPEPPAPALAAPEAPATEATIDAPVDAPPPLTLPHASAP